MPGNDGQVAEHTVLRTDQEVSIHTGQVKPRHKAGLRGALILDS